MSPDKNIAEQIAADIRGVMQPLTGRKNTEKLCAMVRVRVVKILRKYREAGVPIDDVIVLRSLPSNTVHVRVVHKLVVDDDGIPFEFRAQDCPVYDLDRYRQIKNDRGIKPGLAKTHAPEDNDGIT